MPRKTVPQNLVRLAAHFASMRPRPDATENVARRHPRGAALEASMRPRPDATENGGATHPRSLATQGFNEAAARCHGKRLGDGDCHEIHSVLQ